MDLLNSKKQNKKQEEGLFGALLAHLATSLVQPVVFLVVKDIRRRGVRAAERGYIDKTF